jgi:hypothetical protein
MEPLKSPAEAELAALKERNINLKDMSTAYDSGIRNDASQPFRSRTETELAALKEQACPCEPACCLRRWTEE